MSRGLSLAAVFALAAPSAFAADAVTVDPYASLQAAKVSMTAAIERAETAGGGKVLDIRFDDDGSMIAFRADILKESRIVEVGIDARSGSVVDTRSVTPDDDDEPLDDEQQAEIAALRQAKVTLAQAVVTAEKAGGDKDKAGGATPGRAVDAGMDMSGDKPVFAIDVVAAGKLHHVTLDPVSGAVLEVVELQGDMDEDSD